MIVLLQKTMFQAPLWAQHVASSTVTVICVTILSTATQLQLGAMTILDGFLCCAI